MRCLNSARRFSVWGFNRTPNDCIACCDSCRRCRLCVTRCQYWLSSNWSAVSEEQSVVMQLSQVILVCHRMTRLLPILWNKADTLTMFDWLKCESQSHPNHKGRTLYQLPFLSCDHTPDKSRLKKAGSVLSYSLLWWGCHGGKSWDSSGISQEAEGNEGWC